MTPNRIFRRRQELQAMGFDDDSLKVLTDKEIIDMLSGLKALYDLDERCWATVRNFGWSEWLAQIIYEMMP